MISFHKIYGLYGLKLHLMEINEDVNMETTNRKVKIMLVSKSTKDCWTADAILSRNVMAIACTAHFKKKVGKVVGIYVTRGEDRLLLRREKHRLQRFRM